MDYLKKIINKNGIGFVLRSFSSLFFVIMVALKLFAISLIYVIAKLNFQWYALPIGFAFLRCVKNAQEVSWQVAVQKFLNSLVLELHELEQKQFSSKSVRVGCNLNF